MSSCIFCASPCPPKFDFVGGQIRKLSSGTHKNSSANSLSFKGDGVIAQQLQVIFILKDILKIGQDKLCEFLGSSGKLHPEYWISVCSSCQDAVELFYKTFKEVARLENKLNEYSYEFKRRIQNSKGDEGIGPTGMLWEAIRNEVLNGNQIINVIIMI